MKIFKNQQAVFFKDRQAAGKILAQRLKGTKADMVIAIPRGGVVVAKEVAEELKLPLDVIITRKIGSPNQPELALGAVDPDGEAVWDEKLLQELGTRIEELGENTRRETEEIKRREAEYRHERPDLVRLIKDKTVILVDDGMATGATTLSAVKYLKRHGAKVILAVPLASKDALEKVRREALEMVVLDTPQPFQSVGQFYQEFEPVSDEEVVKLLL